MINLKPIEIANKIIELSGINVFENSRMRKYIEVRSLLTYLLREKLNMRWTNIALFYTKNGKPTTHATTIHSCVDYKMHRAHNKKLKEIENMFLFKSNLEYDEIDRIHYLENKCNNLEKKLQKPVIKLINSLSSEKETLIEKEIPKIIKGWEWKNKLNKT